VIAGFLLLIVTGVLWAEVGVVISQVARRGIGYAAFTLVTTTGGLLTFALYSRLVLREPAGPAYWTALASTLVGVTLTGLGGLS
jgi:hypothetical protein